MPQEETPNIKINNEKISINSYFVEYVKQNPLIFFVFFLLLFVYPLHRVVLPKYYGKVITSLKGDLKLNFKSELFENVMYLLGIYAVIQFMQTLNYKVQGAIIPKFSEFAIQKIFSTFIQNKNIDFENLETGEILAKIIKVPNVLYKYMDLLRSLLFSQFFVIIACIIHYYKISLNAALVFIFLVFGITILQYISYKLTLNVELQREKKKDEIYQHFQDILNNLISIVVCKQEEHEKKLLHEQFLPYIKVFEKSMDLNFIMRTIFSLFNIFSFILLNYVIYKEYAKKTIGKEEFVSSFIVTYSILGLFSEGYYVVRSIIDMYSQVNDMEDFFNTKLYPDEEDEKEKETKPQENEENNQEEKQQEKYTNGDIVFENVSFIYKGNEDFKNKDYSYALKDVNIKIKKNENVAVIGQIGSGKSTLVKLLLKLNKPSEGNIKIGNTDIANIEREELLDYLFYVPQKPKLLNRTLYDNIMYGLEENGKTKEENIRMIQDILKKMGISKNIQEIFMEKMDIEMGIDGVKLSGGQRQMVWIIRAMMRDPSILIFDEPTSALDKENKNIIMNAIKKIGQDKTIIIISHDNVDYDFRKITLRQGKVISGGSEGNNQSNNFANMNNNFSSFFNA